MRGEEKDGKGSTDIEVDLVKVAVRMEYDIHVVEASDLEMVRVIVLKDENARWMYVFVTTEVVKEPGR